MALYVSTWIDVPSSRGEPFQVSFCVGGPFFLEKNGTPRRLLFREDVKTGKKEISQMRV